MKSIVSFIVCSNGFGHFKRVLSVCNELIKIDRNLHIHIFCSTKHITFLDNEPNFKIQSNSVEFHDSFFNEEPKWLEKDTISMKKWGKWVVKIKENKHIKLSNIIISDNQIGPLIIGKRVVLMGSFLWPFLTLSEKNVKLIEVQNHEKEMLKEISPECLCVKDMVMPDLSITKQIHLPWFCDKHILRNKSYVKENEFNILLTGGGTEMLTNSLISIFIKLNSIDYFNLFVDSNLYKSLKHIGLDPQIFSFKEENFNKLDLIICRPGLGILTDVVKYNIPICALPEKNNKEIMHNFAKVESLGIGIKYDGNIETIINFSNNDELLNKCIANIEERETGGENIAAKYILNRITEIN